LSAFAAENNQTQWDSVQQWLSYPPLPQRVDVMVVLGVGLGEHIKLLLQTAQIKNLIIYEPEAQYFSCSCMISSWKEIFSLAQQKGTALFIQLEKDGRDIPADISELREHVDFDEFYLYQHYNSPVFNMVSRKLRERGWQENLTHGLPIQTVFKRDEFEPLWLQSADIDKLTPAVDKNARFQLNLAAFEHYFPDIYQQFKDYSPSNWQTVLSAEEECNLLSKSSMHTWYGESPKSESAVAYSAYASHPNRDGLVLGYNGTKLRHYLHYKMVLESEALLRSISEKNGALPDTIKSLIMFGLGAGYQLESLLDNHQVEKLFLCEPNRDFFYASLHAIDWAGILKKTDDAGYRIYINIGDDGANLFRDLLSQFYAIGPYNLAQTYFYQAYYNAELNHAISQLREQLQVVIAMGEYFDHAYYGINQTVEGISRGYPHLLKNAAQLISADQKECPVFLVGNGPSLDYSIEVIKENRDSVIVVSCGTALQTLHRHGIVPDYHAEIEQNRSTYDWAVRLGNKEYLKQITLLSCNGIHPDTCELYKSTMVAFKEGESSTSSNLNLLEQSKYAQLSFAFPTVSNFALNLFTLLGFKQLYLFGIDLGFIDKSHHHSKSSGYYDEQGNPLYDYEEKNNTGLIVPGNFVPKVSTKHEFKVSKMLLEDLLRNYKGDCYNTSNGARINYTQPLPIENVLVLSTPALKVAAMTSMEEKAFSPIQAANYKEDFSQRYQSVITRQELAKMAEHIESTRSGEQDIPWLVERLKNQLFSSYAKGRSLLFYYLYGTINFANAFLLKVDAAENNEDAVKEALAIFSKRFNQIAAKINANVFGFDITSSFGGLREREYLRALPVKPVIPLVRQFSGRCSGAEFDYSNWFETVTDSNALLSAPSGIYWADEPRALDQVQQQLAPDSRWLLAMVGPTLDWKPDASAKHSYSMVVPLPHFDADAPDICLGFKPVMNQRMYEIQMKKCFLMREDALWFIPRFSFVAGNRDASLAWLSELVEQLPAWDNFILYPGYLAIPRDPNHPAIRDALGGRAEWVQEPLSAEHLLGETVTQKEFFNLKRTFHKD
ncbi:6-hydroxymethylpterin diphosphokinase MptE-like protein, partial [Alteromonas sp. AMM-1]|uniref:6-hydroxymethylpterin diphosphokinase MptE-like protein n=1 Tax=Alteromonas sp. AMM-1 TaxID=3394233 RepID=UPI0039A48FED